MSQQDIIAVRLTLSALFLTFFIVASLFVNVISPPQSSPALLPQHVQQHNDEDSQNSGMLDALAGMAIKSFSKSWAYYSPYYPAAPYERSSRKDCVVSQVNIVSHYSHPYLRRCPFRFLASASWGPLSHYQSDKGDHCRARKASGCHEFQRYQTGFYEELHVWTRKGRSCKIWC